MGKITNKILIMIVACMNMSALSTTPEEACEAAIQLKSLSKNKICIALNQLNATNEIIKSLKPKVETLESWRNDYKYSILPFQDENQKLLERIEREKVRLNCWKRSDHDECIATGGNVEIRTYNQMHYIITPKLDRWMSLSSTVEKSFG
jgi:hypothetical protein